MSVLLTALKLGSKPDNTVYIAGPRQPLDVIVVAVDVKPGMLCIPSVGTYANGIDRADTSGDEFKVFCVLEVPTAPEVAIDPARDWVASATNEQGVALLLVPGMIFWARCKDNTTTLAIGTVLVCDDGTNYGCVKGKVDEAVIDTGTTAVTSTAATGAIITGSQITEWRFMALAARATSATESWIPVLVMG